MSVQLNIDDMLDLLVLADHPSAAGMRQRVEELADQLAAHVSNITGAIAGDASFEGAAFAGTCVPFNPASADQPFPEAFDGYDDGGREEWAEAIKHFAVDNASEEGAAA